MPSSTSDPDDHRAKRQSGFALIIVLWALVLLGLLIGAITAGGGGELRIAGNIRTNAAAAAAADGAVAAAIFHFSDPDSRRRWQADGAPHLVTIGQSQVTIRLWDQGGEVNPNRAGEPLLTALLRAVGAGPQQAAAIAAAMVAWRAPLPADWNRGGSNADYRAAGLDYGPPAAPFETLDEIGRVLGMTPALLQALEPHLSLVAPEDVPRSDLADPVVRDALRSLGLVPSTGPLQPAGDQRRYGLVVETRAKGPGGAEAGRRVALTVGGGAPAGYAVRTWTGLD
jgi:general secretion pathway protein K